MTTAATALTEKQRKHLRGLAHALSPVSRLGTAGVTDAFLAEFEAVLAQHELIKLKVTAATRADRSNRDRRGADRRHAHCPDRQCRRPVPPLPHRRPPGTSAGLIEPGRWPSSGCASSKVLDAHDFHVLVAARHREGRDVTHRIANERPGQW